MILATVNVNNELKRIKKQNTILIKRFGQMVNIRKHYLRHKLPYLKKSTVIRNRLNNFIVMYKNLRNLMLNFKVSRLKKGKEKTYLVALTPNDCNRLKQFLKRSHLHCERRNNERTT